jgi:alpha-galactosidase
MNPAFGGESGAYYKWGKTMAEKYAKVDPLQFESTEIDCRSVEYCSWIMEAVTTGKPFKFMGNVRNDGYITNLPNGCCVEVPTFADGAGLHPTVIGKLPPQCAAACMTNVNVQELTAEAALSGDPEHIVHALALDPLTSAVCTLKQIRDMAMEMLEAQRQWLPEFQDRKIRATPTIKIPIDVKPVDVPLDPALAIHKRFGTLINQKTE